MSRTCTHTPSSHKANKHGVRARTSVAAVAQNADRLRCSYSPWAACCTVHPGVHQLVACWAAAPMQPHNTSELVTPCQPNTPQNLAPPAPGHALPPERVRCRAQYHCCRSRPTLAGTTPSLPSACVRHHHPPPTHLHISWTPAPAYHWVVVVCHVLCVCVPWCVYLCTVGCVCTMDECVYHGVCVCVPWGVCVPWMSVCTTGCVFVYRVRLCVQWGGVHGCGRVPWCVYLCTVGCVCTMDECVYHWVCLCTVCVCVCNC